ncbi:YSIRK-type signal peptide-containing protein [Streptococcus pneumoniae]|nr:YSIRK-type signal peptide-containing protein [Streptococcus pneumoniae]
MKHSHKKSFDWYSMQQRYSIRKYYFGAASVLLGTALVLGVAASVQTVQAEENKQETTNSISVGRGEAATKPAEVSASNKEKTYAAPTVANPVETTPVKTEEVTKPAEKVEEAKDKKEEVTHQDAVDKSKLLTALSRAKKLESKLYTEASAANLQTSIQAGQSLLGKADASEAELSAAESSIQSSIIGLELRSNSNKGTVSETPVAKKANIVEAKEETNPAATTDRSAVDSAVLPTSTAAKVETTSAPASTNEILKPGLSLSDARQNPAIRKEDVDRGYSGFRTAGSGFRAAGPENKPILNPNNTIAFSDISQGSHSFRGIGHSRGGREIHYDVTTVRRGNNINFTINYFAPGNLREFVNNNFILDKGTGYGEPTPATVITPNLRNQVKNISKGGNFVSHSGYSLEAAVETNKSQTITFSLPITNPNGDLSLRLRPVEFNVDQGGSGTGTSNDPYSNSNYYFETDPLYLDANPNQANPLTTSFNTKVDFQTLYIPTTKLAEGVTELVSEGVEGEKSQAYRLHKFGDQYVLGLPVGNATTVTAAKPRVMKYGIGKIAATQNKTGDTNHIKFYLDKDGDGVFNNQDEVILNTDIKDGERGPTGATGAQGPAGPKGADGQRGPAGPQGPKGEQGNPGTPGKDGKSLIAVKNGTETKVYVEDPARPGQPLNPNQPLATITDGRNGTNGQSPTITATRSVQNGKNGVLVTITPVEGRPQTTFVEDGQKGADGKTPTVTITEGQNGTHTLTVHNPGSPDVTTTIRDGATGQAGRDGKDVLNGKVNPQPNQGKNGDKYINTETGDVYVKNNGNWDKEGNIKGPKGDKGADGAKGEKGDQGERGLTGAQGAKGADGAVGRDGRDGKDVLNGKANPEAHQGKDGDKYVNTETGDVFVKNNGNWDKEGNIKGPKGDKGADGAKGEKGDRGERGLTGAQGAKGADGAAGRDGRDGRDGKDVLNGKVNPEANQGKDGDKYVNTETGDVFVKNNGNWDKEGNIKGPKGDKGADGAKGEKGDRGERGLTGAQGAKGADGAAGRDGRDGRDGKDVLNGKVNPEANQGKDGDKYVNTETGDVFVKNNGNWDKEGNIKGSKGDKGERGEDGKTPEVTVTPGKDGHSTDITFTVPGKDPVTVNVKDGENGLNGKTPKVDLLRVQGKNGNPSHTIVTFYTDENNDGKYTPGTDELLGSEMIKDGAKGADGRDGKSLLTVKDGKETKVYQEDPANPGQPLNPEKPLAVIRDGVDGKSPTVTAVRKDEAGHKGVEITVDNHDGSQPTTVFVQDGAKGETGATGQDGQTPTITTQRGQDGQSTVVTITTSGKDPVTFTVKDGKNGKDGRAPKIKVEDITSPSRIRRDTDAAATPTRNGIRVTVYDDVNDNGVYDEGVDKVLNSKDIYNGIDGRDGSAPTITTKDNGDGTHTITVQNPDGSESTTVVKDGKDGKTANITTTENPDGSHTITVTNPDGSTKETVVKNGKDGKTPKVEVTDNNDGTHTVKVTDGDGNVTNAIIKDGKAATATTTENPDGSHTVTITNPDGTKNEFVVKNGRDGVDGRTPTASVRDNGDGSHTIVITNPEGVTTETTVRDGKSPKVTITDEQNGTHKISVLNGDGTTTETIIKDGKSPVATVRDNQDGTYTIRVENGNGTVSETTVRDGKSPTAKVVDNGDGTHTITVVNSDGTTTTTTVRDGREPKLEVIDNNDGSHTIKVTGADGKETTTTIFDGKSPKANIVDNGDGTHTLTIVDSDGREYKSIIKDGRDGKDGKCGCQDKPVTPSNDKPVPPTPNVPTPEVPVKPVPAQPTPNVPTPEVPVQPTPAVPTPEVPVPEQPVVPTPAQPATPVNANPVAPTTGKENRGDKLPETGSQSDYISVLLGSGILLSLYVGRRKED